MKASARQGGSKPRPAGSSKGGAGSSKRSSAKPVSAGRPASHRPWDIAGLIVLAFSLIVLISLFTKNSGIIGHALSSLFSLVFGKGAWVIPPIGFVLGITFIRQRGPTVTHLAWGLSLVFLSILGFLAKSGAEGYFFDDLCKSGGGYLGAALAAMFEALLGAGKVVGLGLIGLIGGVLCVDVPIRTMAANAHRQAQTVKNITVEKARTLRSVSSQTQEDRVRPIREGIERAQREAAMAEETVEPVRPTRRGGSAAATPAKSIVMEDPDPEPEAIPTRMAFTQTATPPVTEATPPAKKTPAPQPQPKAKAESTIDEETILNHDLPTPKEGYQLPAIGLLAEAPFGAERNQVEMQKNIETLEGTLEQFGIDATVVEVAAGPTVTRYEIQLGPGIRVARITALAENIAMDLAASQVRVEAPIPGKSAIGVEVPNETPSMVTLRELCDDPQFRNHPSRLYVALGKDVSGVNKYADLTKMPHLLIGGATNSGKSIGLATLITSLLMRNTPKDVRLVMIDPKRVELTLFDHIPHLMCPVIKDTKEAAGVLRAVWREMDRRYDMFSQEGVRNIDGWNQKASFQDKLPYIVVIIDELADLMIQHRAEVETVIVRLAQLARAVGIHMVLATQRPSVDVITGLIKANIPSRLAFSVASAIDSRTILDSKGAEALIGKGDMLFSPIDANKPARIQGCYVSEREIDAVCKFWREQEKPAYVLQPIEENVADAKKEGGDFGEETDPFWEEAVRWVVERNQASTSMLQRKFSIGFQRASRLLDMMEERGIVGPRDGPRPREVMMSLMEVEDLFGGPVSAPRISPEESLEMSLEEDDPDI